MKGNSNSPLCFIRDKKTNKKKTEKAAVETGFKASFSICYTEAVY